jgi:predicted transcriptional regulator
MKYSLIALLFFLIQIVNITVVQGGYTVEPYSSPVGPSDTSGADSTISFFDLPPWIQLAWVISFLFAFFSLIKFGPLLLGWIRDVLKNRNRLALLGYVRNNPGCTITELSKCTGINRGTVRYHLYLLFIERKIIQKKEGKRNYLFTNDGIPLEKKLIYAYIRIPAKKEILTIILNQPGISNKEIAGKLRLERSTVYWHLKQLCKENIVVRRWDGRHMNYFLLPEVEDVCAGKL